MAPAAPRTTPGLTTDVCQGKSDAQLIVVCTTQRNKKKTINREEKISLKWNYSKNIVVKTKPTEER